MGDPVVRKETIRIAIGTAVLSAVMELVFAAIGRWEPSVLFGNLLGAFAAVLNFYLMCLTVVRCVSLEKDRAALKIRASQTGRLFMLAAFAAAGALLPFFNIIAVLVPMLFPHIVIMLYKFTHRDEKTRGTEGTES